MGNLRIENVQQLPASDNEKTTLKKGPAGFGKVINEAIHKVNGLDREANRSIVDLLQGKTNINETMHEATVIA